MNPFVQCLCFSLLLTASITHAANGGTELMATRSDGAETPLRVYQPAPSSPSSSCPPLAILSHGLGGTNSALAYLAEALRADGWLAVVMEHRESGRAFLRDHVSAERGVQSGLLAAIASKSANDARMMDITATLKWANAQCTPPFKVLIGHSMGAATTMLEAGAHNKLGVQGEDRFDAYVPLSPQGPGVTFTEDAWAHIRKPVLLMTGTRDDGTEGNWQWRAQAYKRMSPGCKWLGVIEGAGHMSFSNAHAFSQTPELVIGLALKFLDSLRHQGHCAEPPATTKHLMFEAK